MAEEGERGPLSDRPTDELLAVRAAVAGDHLDRHEARYVVRIVDGQATLFETGDLATVGEGTADTEVTRSTLWRAELGAVISELDRRGM